MLTELRQTIAEVLARLVWVPARVLLAIVDKEFEKKGYAGGGMVACGFGWFWVTGTDLGCG